MLGGLLCSVGCVVVSMDGGHCSIVEGALREGAWRGGRGRGVGGGGVAGGSVASHFLGYLLSLNLCSVGRR